MQGRFICILLAKCLNYEMYGFLPEKRAQSRKPLLPPFVILGVSGVSARKLQVTNFSLSPEFGGVWKQTS